MPIIKSAVKRMRQTAKRRERNIGIKKDIKSSVKAFVAEPSAAALSKAHSELDKAVKKGLIKKNTAARRKSGLHKIAKEAGVKMTATAAKKTTAKPAAAKTAKAPAKKPATTKAPAKKPAAKKTTTAKKPAAKKA